MKPRRDASGVLAVKAIGVLLGTAIFLSGRAEKRPLQFDGPGPTQTGGYVVDYRECVIIKDIFTRATAKTHLHSRK